MSPLVTHFRIYIGKYRKSDWFNVYIFNTQRQMYQFWQNQVKNAPDLCQSVNQKLNFIAQTSHRTAVLVSDDNKEEIQLPYCGQVIFCKKAVTLGTVSHEMTHMSLYWCVKNYDRFDPIRNKEHDEAMAHIQGHLVEQFWKHWNKGKGLIVSRWQNETIEYCKQCGSRYTAGCVKGTQTCPDCRQNPINWQEIQAKTGYLRKEMQKSEEITSEIMNFRMK